MKELAIVGLFLLTTSISFGDQLLDSRIKKSEGIEGNITGTYEFYSIDDTKKKVNLSSALTSTITNPTRGRVAQNVKISSSHHANICNTENYAALFTVEYEVRDELNHYISRIDHVKVDRNSCTKAKFKAFFVNAYTVPHNYLLTAYTEVQSVRFTRSTSFNYAYIV